MTDPARSTPPKAPPRLPVGQAVDRAVRATGRSGLGPTAHTEGRLEAIWLNDLRPGNEALQQITRLVARAREEVCLQSFKWDIRDPDVLALIDTLAARQRANPAFRVNVAYDRDQPGQRSLPAVLAARGVRASTATYTPALSRGSNHAKVVLIDGHTAVTGGANCESKPEKDLMVAVTGPVVATLYRDFDQTWRDAVRRRGPDGQDLPADAPPPRHAACPSGAEPPGLARMTVLAKRGVRVENEDPRHNDADEGLLAALGAATTNIKIQSPNCNDRGVWDAIAAAARRGVHVQVLMPSHYNDLGATIDRGRNQQFVRFLAKLPDEVAARVGLRWYAPDGEHLAPNHTKYVSVDGRWCYVGSQNMDNQSWGFSRELGLGIDDVATTRRLDAAVFDRDWATSKPVKPGLFDRLVDLPARSWATRVPSWLNPRVLLGEIF